MWNVAFFMPGGRDVALIADLARRPDVRLCGVVSDDRAGEAAALAEVMGLPVWPDLDAAALPRGTLLVDTRGDGGDAAAEARRGWRRVDAPALDRLLAALEEGRAPAAQAPRETAGASDLPDELEDDLAGLADAAGDAGDALAAWSAALALLLGAEHVALAVLREDGSLLLAEGTPDGETRLGDGDPAASPWCETLGAGETVTAAAEGDGYRLVSLPFGGTPARAALAAGFATNAPADRFRAWSAALAEPLGRQLDALRQRDRRDAAESRLSEAADMAAGLAGRGDDALRAALMRCSGATTADRLAPDDAFLLEGAARGWLAVVHDGAARLVVDGPGGGWDLLGKAPRRALDVRHFTATDAAAARLLLAAATSRRTVAATPAPASGDVRPDASPRDLLDLLEQEMDRADRYHGAFSLTAFCDRGPDAVDLSGFAGRLRHELRASDRALAGEDGVLFVFAPEETYAVGRLEQRVRTALASLAPGSRLRLASGRALYPGRLDSPQDVVDAALAALDAADAG